MLTKPGRATSQPRGRRSARPRPARRKSGTLASEVLDAARALHFAEGPAGVTARKIAARVGCSATAIYLHYDGIDHVLHLLRLEGQGLLAGYLRRPASSWPAARRLVAMQDEYYRFGKEHPRYFGLMFPASLPGPEAAMGRAEAETLSIVRDAAAAGIARIEIRTDLDPLIIANHCWLAVHGFTATVVSGHLAFTGPDLEAKLLEHIKNATAGWLRGAEETPYG